MASDGKQESASTVEGLEIANFIPKLWKYKNLIASVNYLRKGLLISLVLIFFSLAFFAFPVHLGAAPSAPPAIESGGAASTQKSTPSELSIIFEKAVNDLRGNKLKAARQGFEELIFNRSEGPETVRCYLYLGEIYEKQNLPYEASAIYRQFTQRYPGHKSTPEALIRQGKITLNLGEVKKAQQIFKQIFFQYPGTSLATKASFLLGDSLYASEDKASAHLYYDEGMKRFPQYLNDHPQTAFNIGNLAMQDKNFDQALSIFLALEEYSPQHELTSKAVTFCGDIYVEQGKISEAIPVYQRVIDNYPDSIGALVSQIRMADLGVEHPETGATPAVFITNSSFPFYTFLDPMWAYRETIQTKTASPFHAILDPIWAYRQIMQRKTADLVLVHLAEYKLGLALRKKGKHGEAVTVFQSLLEKAPEERIYQDCLYALKQELVNYLSQNFQKKDYLKVIKIYKENEDLLDSFLREEKAPLPYFEIAQSYQNLNFYPPAIRLYQKTRETGVQDTLSGQISFQLGQIFFQTGEYQKAVDSLREISNSPSLAFAALSLMGDVYREKKDYTKALDHYLAALAIQPLQQGQSIKQLLRVGQCYERLGKTPEAIQSFSKAADLAQKEKATSGQPLAEICLHLADCQYKTQEYTAALKTYQKLSRLSPNQEDRDWVLFQIGNCSLKKAEPKIAQDAFKKLKENNQDTIWPVVSDQWSEVSDRKTGYR